MSNGVHEFYRLRNGKPTDLNYQRRRSKRKIDGQPKRLNNRAEFLCYVSILFSHFLSCQLYSCYFFPYHICFTMCMNCVTRALLNAFSLCVMGIKACLNYLLYEQENVS